MKGYDASNAASDVARNDFRALWHPFTQIEEWTTDEPLVVQSSEGNELSNHNKNVSWVTITRDELPKGRKVHKLIWVYKVKRDGTAKSRLCVQGTTLEAGVDFE